ncbi:MAG: hypothetical protein GTO14_18855 [Anaerolineales bacterium]|nr:hypothetical protein [Anaerolineales bacterium]
MIIVIPILAALAVGLISFALLRIYLIQQTERADERRPLTVTERLVPLLGVVAVPVWVSQRWGTPDVVKRLVYAGAPWKVGDYVALRWLLIWLAAISAIGLGSLRGWDLLGQFLALILMMSGWLGPSVWLAWQVERRQTEIDIALPNFLDRLALGLEAGLSFDLSLKRIAGTFSGLLGEDLRRLVRQLGRGHSRSDALDELVQRNPSQDLRAFVTAVKQSDRLGTSLAKALRVQTDLLRSKRRRRAEEASRRLPILIVFPLVFFFLPALLIIYLAPPVLHLFLGR